MQSRCWEHRCNSKSGATVEVYLDIEVVGAMAPQATIDVYFAPWTGQGYFNAITQAIHNDDYAAVSISYGLDEDLAGSPDNEAWPHTLPARTRFSGMRSRSAFLCSSRPATKAPAVCGANSATRGSDRCFPDAHAGYPASSPYATAVGGTLLYAQNGQISQEIVWNELGSSDGTYLTIGPTQMASYYFGGATGGGVSDRYAVPSYQSSAGINLKSANSPSVTGRGVPDVAGNSGETTGYLITAPVVQSDPSAEPVRPHRCGRL